jgi:hypothetical protein
MLGMSLGKLLVLAAIILIVWYGFKYTQRVGAVRETLRRGAAEKARPAAGPAARPPAAEDLVKCERCGAYVAAGSSAACGRADCPWGR